MLIDHSHDHDKPVDDGMECVRVYSEREEREERDVVFYGKSIAYDEYWDSTAYLTKGHRIAVYNPYNVALEVFDTFQEFTEAFRGRPQLVIDVADARDKPAPIVMGL